MIRILVLGICIGVTVQLSQPGPLPPTACQDYQATDECLQEIKGRFNSDSMFWWGTWFDSNCPSPKPYCNKQPGLPDGKTLKSVLPGIEDTQITKFLNVSYTSNAGSYEGCDTKVTREEPISFTLDPTSSDRYRSWDARGRPQITWETDGSEKYTLMVLDIGVGVVHGVWANIEDGLLPGDGGVLSSNIDVVKMYSGPKNSNYEWPNPYVFLLFKQTQENDITIDKTNLTSSFHLQTKLPEYMATYGLEGPVAINWLITEGDIYGAQFFISLKILNNCPYFITRALKDPEHNGRPFLPTDRDMSVFIHVSIATEAISYTICCEEKSSPAKEIKFDPIANPTFTAVETRTDNEALTVTFTKAGFMGFPQMPNVPARHTLLVVDPDVPIPTAGTNSRPILHMMVTNIKDLIFDTGDFLQPYQGPMPPDNNTHVYYFLLYQQKDGVEFAFNFTEVQRDYMGPNACGRCLFDVSGFVTQNQLELVGATWMSVPNDKYVDYAYVKRGRNESDYCSDVEGWSYGETCGAGNAIVNAAVLTCCFILSKLLF